MQAVGRFSAATGSHLGEQPLFRRIFPVNPVHLTLLDEITGEEIGLGSFVPVREEGA